MGNETTPGERLAADLAAGDDGECAMCARAPGLILLGAAAILGFIGLDMLTGGWLTRLLSAARPAAEAAVAAVAGDGDPGTSAVAGEVVSTDGADQS